LGTLPRLEELDHVSGGVLEQDLRAAGTADHVIPETQPLPAEPGDLGTDVVDDELDAVPSTGPGPAAVRHRAAGRAGRAREEEPEVPARDVGEGRAALERSVKPRWV